MKDKQGNQGLLRFNRWAGPLQFWIKSEGKWILLIMLFYTPFYLLVMALVFRQGKEQMESIYGTPDLWFPLGIHSLIEVTAIYYLLIFHVALPLLRTKNYKIFFTRIILFFLILFIYEYFLNFYIGSPAVKAGQTFEEFLVWHIIIDVVILFIAFAVALLIELNVKSKVEKELEKQKSEAELSAIKYQINPHFLFNSLSFIYSKAIVFNEEVAQAVLLLSDIMRYALSREEDKQGKVDIMMEIAHMKNVIKINQMRFNHKLNIKYVEQIDNPTARIPPLVLITLVENAFKHGELNDPDNPLTIKIAVDMVSFHIYMCNKKKTGSKEISNGIGLSNVSKRLELIYGIRHQFKIKEDEHYYITNLTIDL